jgi:hypothetical protein
MHVSSSWAGADYVFRVNDDTEIETVGWAGLMAARLASFRPINVGVVGPSGRHDASQSRKMITHDFVHKTHLRIFATYYPPVLSDWWMDDWISNVYPSSNSLKMREVVVVHHTEVVAKVHKTDPGDPVRYEVDFGHKAFLRYATRQGLAMIETFIQSACQADDCTPPSQEPMKRGGARSGSADGSIDALTNSYSRGTAEDDQLVANDAVSLEEEELFGETDSFRKRASSDSGLMCSASLMLRCLPSLVALHHACAILLLAPSTLDSTPSTAQYESITRDTCIKASCGTHGIHG